MKDPMMSRAFQSAFINSGGALKK